MPEEKDALGFDIVGGSPSSAPEQSTAPSQKDPLGFDIIGGGSPSPSPTPAAQPSEPEPTSSAPAVDPLGFTVVGGSSSAPSSSAPTAEPASDPNAPWYKRAWDWANHPLVDIDSALGRSGKAGGFEKGANDLVSSLTSPLSLAIAIGTLGSGSLVEVGGATALRGVGMAASEIGEVTKGAQIVADTLKAGRTAQEGMAAAEAAGINPEILTKGLQTLKDASLDTSSLLSKGLVRNAGTKFASSLGLGAKEADMAGQGLQFLTSAGFTAQQALQAAELFPRVLDAIRAGDYEEAERLGVDALGSAVLGGLGAHQIAKESGALMSDISAKAGLKVKPSEENLTVRNNFGEYDKNVTMAGRSAELWAQDLRKEYGKMDPTQLERIRYYIEAGSNPETMARRYNTIAEAAGRDVKLPIEETPENGQALATSGLSSDRIAEVAAQKNIAAKYKPEEVDKLLDAYDPTKLTDADKELARKIHDKYNETLEYAQQNGALGEGVQDYVTNLWKEDEGNNSPANRLKHDAATGQFNTNTTMARSRIFDNSFEGQLFGKKLAETDPILLSAHNSSTFARVVEARKAIERLADNGARASDGRPLVALSGDHSISGEGDPTAVFVNPKGIRSTKIADNVVQGLKDSGDLDRMIQEGKIKNITQRINPDNLPAEIDRLESKAISASPKFDEEGNNILRRNIQTLKDVRDGKLAPSALDSINAQRPDVYAWDPKDYAHVDHPSLQAWNHLGPSPSGDSVLLKSDMRVHPEIKDYLERRLGVDSQGPLDNPIGRFAAKAGSEAKGLTLSLSPFHIVQIGLRGVMSGVSPFKIEKWDLANDPVLAKGVEQGLTLKTNYANRSAFSDGTMKGHSAVLDKIPGINKIQNSMNQFLFDKYLPAVKSSTYKALVDRYQKAYPTWTTEKVAEVAADDVNNRFGGLNYKRLGRSAASQNWFKLAALAPDFLEGEIRSIARPFGTEGAISRQDFARMAAYMWMSARVLNMITSGQPHMEAPFGVAVKTDSGKESVISIRSLPGDLMHAASDPVGFIRNRMGPVVRTGAELYSGTNSFGQKLDRPSLVGDIVRNNIPIPLQSIGKAISGQGPETGNMGQVIGALGGTDTVYRTEAQKLASKVASDHMESGPVDQASLQRHQMTMKLEESLRSGEITPSDISQLVLSGKMPQADAKKVMTNIQKTQGLSPELASLYTKASRLPTKDLLDVYTAGTQEERKVLAPLVQKSGMNYAKSVMTKLTPEERLQDPTLKRVMAMMPSATPF